MMKTVFTCRISRSYFTGVTSAELLYNLSELLLVKEVSGEIKLVVYPRIMEPLNTSFQWTLLSKYINLCFTNFPSFKCQLTDEQRLVNRQLSCCGLVTPYIAEITEIWVNIGPGNSLLQYGDKPLPEPIFTYDQRSSVALILAQFHEYFMTLSNSLFKQYV